MNRDFHVRGVVREGTVDALTPDAEPEQYLQETFADSRGSQPWAMPSEVFPSSLRAKGVALSTCSNW